MLRDELVAVAEVTGEVPADAIGACHQHVNEVVDDDRDLSTNDRLQPNRPISLDSHSLPTLQSWRPMDEEAPWVRGHSRTVSVREFRLGLSSGWCRCSLSVA